MKQKFLLLFALMLTALTASAYDFEVNGIYYTKTSETTVAVDQTPNNVVYAGNIEIPSTVTYSGNTYTVNKIKVFAFRETYIKSIKIPSTVTEIEDAAFQYCTTLKSIEIPNSVTKIGAAAFQGCTNLKSVKFPNSITEILKGTFSGCNSLESIDIPNTVTYIEAFAFHQCISLTSLVIPNSVTVIDDFAFYECMGLTTIEFGESVTKIGDNAFCGPELKEVISKNPTPPTVEEHTFGYFDKSKCLLKVPVKSIKTYKSAFVWKEFMFEEFDDEITLYDSEEYTETDDMDYEAIHYVREFKNTSLQPLYVPFEMSYADWDAAGLVVYSMLEFVDNGDVKEDLEIKKMTSGTVLPNTPYLVKANSIGEKTITVRNKTLKAAEINEIKKPIENYTAYFMGNYTKKGNLNMPGLYVLSGGYLCTVDNAEAQLGAFRWYLSIPNAKPNYAPRFRVVDEEATGISSISSEQRDSKVYTIDGRLMNTNALPRGLYIKNGKKFLVK